MRFWAMLAAVLLWMSSPALAEGEGLEAELYARAAEADLGPWEAYWADYAADTGIGGSLADFLVDTARGGVALSPEGLWRGMGAVLARTAGRWVSFGGQLTATAMLPVLLRHAGTLRPGADSGRTACAVLQWCAVGTVALRLGDLFVRAAAAAERMLSFCNACIPVLMAMTAAMGSGVTAGLMQPAMASVTALVGNVLQSGAIPGLHALSVMTLISHLRADAPLSGLTAAARSLCQWVLGAVMTVFSATLTVQNQMASALDGFSLRTARYAVDTAIPFGGGIFADMVDTVAGCSALIRSAMGAAGLGMLMWMAMEPLAELAGFYAMLRLAGALAVPLGAGEAASCMEETAKNIRLLFSLVLFVGVLLFIMMAMTVGAGNALFLAGG